MAQIDNRGPKAQNLKATTKLRSVVFFHKVDWKRCVGWDGKRHMLEIFLHLGYDSVIGMSTILNIVKLQFKTPYKAYLGSKDTLK